jgi:hypothetical protein
MTKAGACLLTSVVLAACGVGDEGGNNEPDPNPNRLKCSAAFTTTGSFTPGTPGRPLVDGDDDPLTPPTEVQGCWPVGTWTFTASIDNAAVVTDITGDGNGDRCGELSGTNAPAVEASYSFRVDRTDDPDSDGLLETYTYLGSSPNFAQVKISEGGGGDCEGIMEFLSQDKREHWTFNPSICTSANCQPPSNNIAGVGDYIFYLDPQPL